MLENYYLRPATIDRIQQSWIAPVIEQYVAWMVERHYTARSVLRRIPLAVRFGDFAKAHGAGELTGLPDQVEPFVQEWVGRLPRGRSAARRKTLAKEVRGPIQQLLRVALPDYAGRGRTHKPDNPFARQAPGWLQYLTDEKGLRPNTLKQYRHHLHRFAAYLQRAGVEDVAQLTPTLLSGFVAEYAPPQVSWTTVRNACGALRVWLRYLHREGVIARDLSPLVEFPQAYRHAGLPRSISWDQVEQVLAAVDRRAVCGKRDYAMLVLLATYGLRAAEVANLTLDDIDWHRDRLTVRARKVGNTTTYPLSDVAGAAIVDYLKHGRPTTTLRQVFLRSCAPVAALSSGAVVCCAARYIRQAGLPVPRAGSHVLRHSCMKHLVNARFSLKQIGDYVGHRSTSSTQLYAKVAIEQLREVALGDGEEVV